MRINNKYIWENDLSLNDLVLKQKERIEYLERSNNRREDEILELRKENADLDNIINELEKWLEEQLMYFNENNAQGGFSTNVEDLEIVKDKLQELKGDGSNE